MSKKILITGISGFIGRSLTDCLNEKGYDIYGIDKNQEDINATVYKGDILNLEKTGEILTDIQPDVVIHLAAISYLPKASKTPFQAYDINSVGTYNLAKAFEESDAHKFIFASSAKVYGNPNYLPIDENHPLNPSTVYGKSKKLAEEFVEAVSEGSEKEFVVLRQFNTFGKNQNENFLIPTIINQMKKSDTIGLGNIDVKRDFLYIDDLIRAYELIIEKDLGGFSVFNTGVGRSYSVKEIVENVNEVMGKNVEIKSSPSKVREENMDEYADISKIKGIGWEPEISLREGIRRIVE